MGTYTPVSLNEFQALLKPVKGWTLGQVGKEVVLDKKLLNGVTLRVYSSIDAKGECRRVGADAIRICAFHPSKKYLCRKSKRVFRTKNWRDRVKKHVLNLFCQLTGRK